MKASALTDNKKEPRVGEYVSLFENISLGDEALVGMKSIGLKKLMLAGLPAPRGIVLNSEAFRCFLQHNRFLSAISDLAENRNGSLDVCAVIARGEVPTPVQEQLFVELKQMGLDDPALRLAVRSSSNYEDLKEASFAGLYRSFLNTTKEDLLRAVVECYASLYSPRSLTYLTDRGARLNEVAMAVVVQESINAECAGTVFTADANSGFRGLHHIEGVWGFGESVVSGRTLPNSWNVSKENNRIISRSLGDVQEMMVATDDSGLSRLTDVANKRDIFCLTDDEVLQLAQSAEQLEQVEAQPLDIEWVKSKSGRLFFLQMRPLAASPDDFFVSYTLADAANGHPLLRALPITQKTVSGRVVIEPQRGRSLGSGDIAVFKYLDLDWLPFIKNVGGIIVETGGYTSHISIILREHSIPSLLGAEGACSVLREGQIITLACAANEGLVWDGVISVSRETVDLRSIRKPRHKICVVTSTLTNLDQYLRLPVDGIGLVRLEFVVHQNIGIHPLALIDYDRGAPQSKELRTAIEQRTRGFASKREFYIERLAEGICAFACRCSGKIINVRAPDFITGDYLKLLGGDEYEHESESNPMLGWRGTTRLIDKEYAPAFEMDCEAFRRAIDVYGFKNINILVPFCRTPSDAAVIRSILRLKSSKEARVGMMVEIPSNVMLAAQFAEVFDFFLIGPMDLTQLTYGADRTAWRLSRYCNETEAVKEMVKQFLRNIQGRDKDVFIGGWPLFQYLSEYDLVKTNNRLHLVELPDRLLPLFETVRALEESIEVQ